MEKEDWSLCRLGLRDIEIKPVYYSDEDDLLRDFYIPVLSNSVTYDRIAGYFSSNALAIAAKGIAAFISNGGRIRLIANVVLSENDQEAIKRVLGEKERAILAEIENLEDQLKKDHIRMLGWMIKNKRLEIKIAVVKNGVEHQKTGILHDNEGEVVSFTGSDNETVRGWLHNDEVFHVFCSWRDGDREHLSPDISRFDRLWSDKGRRVRVYSVSDACKKGLIRTAPATDEEFKELSRRVTKELLNQHARSYPLCRITAGITLRDYQQKAIRCWSDNGRRGIFEMATGTGKTFTALGCISSLLCDSKRLVTIITAPYSHLLQQWRRETEKFGCTFDRHIVADSSNPSWKNYLADCLTDVILGYRDTVVVFTTHSTFSSKDFGKIVSSNKQQYDALLVADEVHGVGAEATKLGLIDCYDYRLGLSATPRRWFDDAGTMAIFSYFGDTVFEFTLEDAINSINPDTNQTYLTPYKYEPVFVSLGEDELEEYVRLTYSIVKTIAKSSDVFSDKGSGQLLLFKRANIIKNATSKHAALRTILGKIETPIRQTIVYCAPGQINQAMSIIGGLGLHASRFTMQEGTMPKKRFGGRSEREFILEQFTAGHYQALVAMRCLDEGIDVPQAITAIIMASSGNPREYIQRIGRVIRRHPGKDLATIYDMIVVPAPKKIPPELRRFEHAVFERELTRYEEIARLAVNNASVLRNVYEIKERIIGGFHERT